jgi:hypothetical protein
METINLSEESDVKFEALGFFFDEKDNIIAACREDDRYYIRKMGETLQSFDTLDETAEAFEKLRIDMKRAAYG